MNESAPRSRSARPRPRQSCSNCFAARESTRSSCKQTSPTPARWGDFLKHGKSAVVMDNHVNENQLLRCHHPCPVFRDQQRGDECFEWRHPRHQGAGGNPERLVLVLVRGGRPGCCCLFIFRLALLAEPSRQAPDTGSHHPAARTGATQTAAGAQTDLRAATVF